MSTPSWFRKFGSDSSAAADPKGAVSRIFESQTGNQDRYRCRSRRGLPGGGAIERASVARVGMALVRGRFNATKIEALMREHGAKIETYKGKRLLAADVTLGPAGPTASRSRSSIQDWSPSGAPTSFAPPWTCEAVARTSPATTRL